MSGLEPLVGVSVAAAGSVAPTVIGRIAATFVMNLAKSSSLRWRISKRVRKQTGIAFSAKRYRAWLKGVATTDLRKPAGEAGPSLAVSLDTALSSDEGWFARSDRHSSALEIVQETYLAVVGLAAPEDAAALKETWAQSRHGELLGLMTQLIAGPPKLSREDFGTVLLAQSAARRRRRLASFGVVEESVIETMSLLDDALPAAHPGKFVVVVGAFGAGKSELAEVWFRQFISSYTRGISPAIPAWLHASEIGTRALEEVLAIRYLGTEHEPCALVVDGLDEVDSQIAARVVDQVGVFVESRGGSTALLTCRPGVLPESDEQWCWDGLSRDQARKLIESVSGRNHATWDWNPALLESVRRPFFAIGAGIMLADGTRPSSQADLVRRLVERALALPSSAHISVRNSELYRLLVRAAVGLTRSGGRSDELTFQERQQLRATRLITGSGNAIEFALPIFQQWFAAQALLEQEELLLASTADAAAFDRWRWSLAIAGISVSTAEQFDELARSILRSNPGAGAWILNQVSSAHEWPNSSENEFLEGSNAGQRILLAARTWINATAPLASLLFPVNDANQRISLRVAVSGGVVSTVWDREVPPSDVVSQLSSDFRGQEDGSWLEFSSGVALAGFDWPWAKHQDRISKRMAKMLEGAYRLGPVDGVWHNESRYRLARELANTRSPMFAPLDRHQVASVVHDFLSQWDEPLNVRWSRNGSWIHGTNLVDLAAWLDSLDGDLIHRPLPAPDQDPPGGWVWSLYSDERLQEFTAEAYGQACVAYDEARATTFSAFSWSMGMGTPGEFGVVAILTPAAPSGGWEGGPALVKAVVPLRAVKSEARRLDGAARLSANGRALVVARDDAGLPGPEAEHDYFVQLFDSSESSGSEAFRRRSIMSSIVDSTSNSRPASEIAARWIWEDLKAVKLADGAQPNWRS